MGLEGVQRPLQAAELLHRPERLPQQILRALELSERADQATAGTHRWGGRVSLNALLGFVK